MTDYQSIDCGFYDELAAAATRQQPVALQYINELRELHFATGVIDTLLTREHTEFLRLQSGQEIRLDRIIRLDDKRSPGFPNQPDFSQMG